MLFRNRVIGASRVPSTQFKTEENDPLRNTTTLGPQFRLLFLIGGDTRDVNGDYQGEEDEEEADIVFANPGSFPTLAGLAWSVSACHQVL